VKRTIAFCLATLAAALQAQQIKSVSPASGPPPIGPFSPGVVADGYLYVSGQGAKDAQGRLPETFDAQMRQTLANVKGIVEAAGLTLDHVVYTHLYLADMAMLPEADRIWQVYFGKNSPARATVGVARLPGTPVEINAVAAFQNDGRRQVSISAFKDKPYPAAVLTRDRLFVSSVTGSGATPQEEVTSALNQLKTVTEAAGLSLKHMVFINPYLTAAMPADVMNREYAQRFEFGNTPARATISVNDLAASRVAFTGVAVRDLSQRRAVRPKNMPPSPTASPCVFAGKTLYCSAKSGFIPGPHSGIYAATVGQQLRQTFRNLLDNLEEAGLDFKNVAATNVYLDNMDDFAAMNKIYAEYLSGDIKPARTTVQQVKPGSREPDADARYPTFEQISLIAVQ
jgi:reactive intermediate/imine deaminase